MKKDTNLLDTQDVRAEAATALTPTATNGEKIKALRTAQGMSMAELSRRASMSDRAIRYIEAGEREVYNVGGHNERPNIFILTLRRSVRISAALP